MSPTASAAESSPTALVVTTPSWAKNLAICSLRKQCRAMQSARMGREEVVCGGATNHSRNDAGLIVNSVWPIHKRGWKNGSRLKADRLWFVVKKKRPAQCAGRFFESVLVLRLIDV